MKKQKGRCACGLPGVMHCIKCGATLCEDHTITGIDSQGRKERRCAHCDRAHQKPSLSGWLLNLSDQADH